jgi:hypothetical protein
MCVKERVCRRGAARAGRVAMLWGNEFHVSGDSGQKDGRTSEYDVARSAPPNFILRWSRMRGAATLSGRATPAPTVRHERDGTLEAHSCNSVS